MLIPRGRFPPRHFRRHLFSQPSEAYADNWNSSIQYECSCPNLNTVRVSLLERSSKAHLIPAENKLFPRPRSRHHLKSSTLVMPYRVHCKTDFASILVNLHCWNSTSAGYLISVNQVLFTCDSICPVHIAMRAEMPATHNPAWLAVMFLIFFLVIPCDSNIRVTWHHMEHKLSYDTWVMSTNQSLLGHKYWERCSIRLGGSYQLIHPWPWYQ